MKSTSQPAALAAALVALCGLLSLPAHAQSSVPSRPMGSLSAYPSVVQTGTKPTLTWSILYPSRVGNLATITLPGTITIVENNTMVSVHPIGMGVTESDPVQGTIPLPVDARLSLNGSSYIQLFYGTQTDVNPAWVLYSKKLKTGDKLNFGGRFVKNNSWSSFFTTLSGNMQVIVLKDGDTPPTTFPLHQSSQLANYLRPYLDASGKVNVGPMSLLILMELNQTNNNLSSFDYQDSALLLTFNGKTNNGHGNNLDGVDSSNPGKGSGGPTGLNNSGQDPSGGVDDEIR